MQKSLVYIMGFVFLLAFAGAAEYNSTNTLITECGKITESGVYDLQNSIHSNKTCLTISAANVTLNGNGFVVKGDGFTPLYGIHVSSADGVILNDLVLINYPAGIYLDNSDFASLSNINSTGSMMGLFISRSNDCLVTGSSFSNNLDRGVSLYESSNNLFVDSYATGTFNKDFYLDSNSIGNIALNTIYSTKSVSSDSELITQWYLDISANPTGVNLSGAPSLVEGRNILVEGNYTIGASKEGYADEYQNVSLFGSKTLDFNLTDNSAPVITLLSPVNLTSYTSNSLDLFFSFEFKDLTSVETCLLYLNGLEKNSSFMGLGNGNASLFVSAITPGSYNWSVTCNDSAGNIGLSESWQFGVNPIVIIATSSGGGGGGSTQQNCSAWSACVDGIQTSTCNNGAIKTKTCVVEAVQNETLTEEATNETGVSTIENEAPENAGFLTGAVIGNLTGRSLIGIIFVILLLVAALWYVIAKRRKSKAAKSETTEVVKKEKKSKKK
jgi:parallel beta-helix repeat protein